jgi:hypothetical protein
MDRLPEYLLYSLVEDTSYDFLSCFSYFKHDRKMNDSDSKVGYFSFFAL